MTTTYDVLVDMDKELGKLLHEITMAKNEAIFSRRFDAENRTGGEEGFLGVFRFGDEGEK